MEIFKKPENIPNLTLALGFFDGVHKGHQKVISGAVEYAKKNGLKSAVITMKKQPFCCLKNIKPVYISTREKSYKLIEKLGIDYIFELDFEDIKNLNASEYIENILVKYFSPKAIFTGFNHHFGLNRQGNTDFLEKHQDKYGYKYFLTEAQKINNTIISSSAIRNFIKNGEIEKANEMLGREFSICAKVIEGNKIGRTIGFPTANIQYPENIISPPKGVYSTEIKLGNEKFKSISNYGTRPTISENEPVILESHLLNFDRDIYNEYIEINFLKKIRDEIKFDNLDSLKKQIQTDILQI